MCAVLIVRLAADFVPLFLEAHPFDDGISASCFLGYPLVPFWLAVGPLALVLGVVPEYAESAQLLTTAFLGAFATAKGITTLQDAAAGRHELELVGGARCVIMGQGGAGGTNMSTTSPASLALRLLSFPVADHEHNWQGGSEPHARRH